MPEMNDQNVPVAQVGRTLKRKLEDRLGDQRVNVDAKRMKVYIGSNFNEKTADDPISRLKEDDPSEALFVFPVPKLTRELISRDRQAALLRKEAAEVELSSSKAAHRRKSPKKGKTNDAELAALQRKLDTLVIQNEQVIAENQRVFAQNQRVFAENQRVMTRNDEIVAQNAGLQRELLKVITAFYALHRRALLDQAKDKLFQLGVIGLDDHPTADEVALNRLVAKIRKTLPELPDSAIRRIFATGSNTLRNAGNEAAHEASMRQISDAILDQALMENEKVDLEDIFIWVYGHPPVLE